jgi:hypothetical protein
MKCIGIRITVVRGWWDWLQKHSLFLAPGWQSRLAILLTGDASGK